MGFLPNTVWSCSLHLFWHLNPLSFKFKTRVVKKIQVEGGSQRVDGSDECLHLYFLFFSSFYLQVVKSRGRSSQCGGLSLMGWEGSGATHCCGDPAKNLVKLSQ